MMQSRGMSLLEAVANVVVGYALAIMTQIAVFPLCGLQVSIAENILIGAIFTIVSLMRSYALRRIFNKLHSQEKAAPGRPGRRDQDHQRC
jgi:hypothetical protein